MQVSKYTSPAPYFLDFPNFFFLCITLVVQSGETLECRFIETKVVQKVIKVSIVNFQLVNFIVNC